MRSLAELMDLRGRKALIAGGAGHIALAVGEALAELGASVAVVDKDAAACRERARLLSRSWGGGAVAVPCDLGNERAARSAAREALRRLGGLDILVHCAAYTGDSNVPGWALPLPRQTVRAWDRALAVNLTSAFVLIQELRDALARSRRGSVILFASIYGLVGPDHGLYKGTRMANPLGYGVSKGGLLQMVRSLASELAPGIRVNAISPGGVLRGQPAAFRRRYAARTPLKRMAVEEDLKGAAAYLACDLSSYVSGHNLIVDGGWTSC